MARKPKTRGLHTNRFIAAVRAEALEPRERSPELEKAEEWLDITGVHLGLRSEPRVIAEEIDRLRAEVKRLEAENAKLRKLQADSSKALGHAHDVLRRLRPYGHDGDEDSPTCDEDCHLCDCDAAMAHADDVLGRLSEELEAAAKGEDK